MQRFASVTRDPDEARSIVRAALEAHGDEPIGPTLLARGLGSYRGYAGALRSLLELEGRGARLSILGRSNRGEPLVGVELGARAPRRTSVVLSLVHPIEWIGLEASLALLGRLASCDLGDRAVLAVPIVNPDGVRRVEAHLRAGRRRFVRHNARGVDLNRNFDTAWSHKGLGGRLLRGLFFGGARPASEPEVEALACELATRRVDRALSLHSFGGAVLTPYAHAWRPPPDVDEHLAWARDLAMSIDPARPYDALPCSWWAKGVRSGGLELDWLHERHGALSLLVECSRGGLSRARPATWLEPFAWFNPPRPAVESIALAEAALPFVRGDLRR